VTLENCHTVASPRLELWASASVFCETISGERSVELAADGKQIEINLTAELLITTVRPAG
jgi:hypothetical protein